MIERIIDVASLTDSELAILWIDAAVQVIIRAWWILPLVGAGVMGAIESIERRGQPLQKHESAKVGIDPVAREPVR